jgi:hypothetical protein
MVQSKVQIPPPQPRIYMKVYRLNCRLFCCRKVRISFLPMRISLLGGTGRRRKCTRTQSYHQICVPQAGLVGWRARMHALCNRRLFSVVICEHPTIMFYLPVRAVRHYAKYFASHFSLQNYVLHWRGDIVIAPIDRQFCLSFQAKAILAILLFARFWRALRQRAASCYFRRLRAFRALQHGRSGFCCAGACFALACHKHAPCILATTLPVASGVCLLCALWRL